MQTELRIKCPTPQIQHMKLNLLLLLSLTLIISCTSEKDKSTNSAAPETEQAENNDELKTTFANDINTYFTAFNGQDWDAVNEMIFPKLFDLITKDQMKQTFVQMQESGMDMKTSFQKIDSTSKVISHEGSKYCRIYYDADLEIALTGEMLESLEFFKMNFNDAYGAENVKFDESTSTFSINAIKSMLAVKSETPDHWTYIEYTGPQDQVIQQMIPAPVLQQLTN